MVNMVSKNYTTGVAEFVADTAADLSLLPTLTECGKDNLSTIRSVGVGSNCFVTETSDVYMLRGDTNSWTVI